LDTTINGTPCKEINCYINIFPEITEHNDSIYTSPAVHPQNCTPDQSGEGLLANHMVSMLELIAMKRKGGDARPFFFAAGFHRPHIPWHAPQEFYDLYKLDMPLAPHTSPPITSEGSNATDVDSLALNNNWVGTAFNYSFGGKLFPVGQGYWTRSFKDLAAVEISPYMPRDGTGPPELAQQKVRQAYRAALSFTDRNIGVVLDAAKSKGLYENAIVVLWADHGYQLGDNGQWGKHTDFEVSAPIHICPDIYAHTYMPTHICPQIFAQVHVGSHSYDSTRLPLI
jgi:arylsulfatase A-like enzyme